MKCRCPGTVEKSSVSNIISPWFSGFLWIFHLLFHKLLKTVWKKPSFTQGMGKIFIGFPKIPTK